MTMKLETVSSRAIIQPNWEIAEPLVKEAVDMQECGRNQIIRAERQSV
jgi:hypothetical protein